MGKNGEEEWMNGRAFGARARRRKEGKPARGFERREEKEKVREQNEEGEARKKDLLR
jgi:hypothetical protein